MGHSWTWHTSLPPTFHQSDIHHMAPLNYKGGWEEWVGCVLGEEVGKEGE